MPHPDCRTLPRKKERTMTETEINKTVARFRHAVKTEVCAAAREAHLVAYAAAVAEALAREWLAGGEPS